MDSRPPQPDPLQPPPPPPLDYATPAPRARRITPAVISAAIRAIAMSLLLTAAVFWIVPRFEGIYKDFKVNLPALTVIVFQVSRFCRAGGIVLFWAMAACVPVLVYVLGADPVSGRSFTRAVNLLFLLLSALVFAAIAAAVFLPMITLIDAVSSSKR